MSNIKKSFYWFFALCLCQGVAQAQTFAIPFSLTQASPAIVFSLDTYGILMSTGTENGTAVLSSGEQGAGTRLLWYPGKAAFRAGYVSGTDWNDANIGTYSVAFGSDTIASGSGAVAMGSSATASSSGAVAMGSGATASNSGATAIGQLALASGSNSIAIGYGNIASGNNSIAMGLDSTASGYQAVALGFSRANSLGSTTVGFFNLGLSSTGATSDPLNWVATDPLFEVGNGGTSYAGNRTLGHNSDALVVYKNGNVTAQGVITAAPGGDIPMFTGN